MTQNTRKFSALLLVSLFLSVLPAVAEETKGAVNINAAGAEELALLPRVGETVAQRIIEFREENGGFQAIEDLMLVKGIGEKTFALIEPHVTLKGETTLAEKVRVPRSTDEAEQS